MISISKLYYGLAGQSDHLRYGADESGPVVVYNCTSRCNLRCMHCYSSSQAGCDGTELTTVEAKRLLGQLAEANCPVVLFSGGEPLLRPDLVELVAEATRLKIRAVVSTNGTLIDDSAAKALAAAAVSYVGVSVDGEEFFHDRFRRVEGSFRSAIRGIENCRRHGIRVGLRFTITRRNAEHVPYVFELAAAVGVRRICFYHLIRTGRARQIRQEALEAEQIRQVVDTIIEKTGEYIHKGLVDEVLTVDNHADGPYLLLKMLSEGRDRYEQAERLLQRNGGNRVGEKIACVGWDGRVYPDQFWRNYSLGSVKDRPFGEIWSDVSDPVLQRLRNKSEFADARCLRCRWFSLCKGNYRFLGDDPGQSNWLNEPACYLWDEEIAVGEALKQRR